MVNPISFYHAAVAWDLLRAEGVHVSECPNVLCLSCQCPQESIWDSVYTEMWLSPLIITNCFRKLLLCRENCSQALFRASKCLAVFEGQLLFC